MTNIGLLGVASVGKTSILRLFVLYVKKNLIQNIEGGKSISIIKTDFSGEATLNPQNPESDKETKTIYPNKVIFKEDDTGVNHTLFGPGGDRTEAVVRMGIITISRIAKQIVTVFAADKPIKDQFDFYNDIRYFPKEIYVCINKSDLVNDNDREKVINEMEEKIKSFFNKKNIKIKGFYRTCAESNEKFKEYNDNAIKMLLDIALSNK